MRQVAQILKSNGTDGEIIMGFRGVDPDDIDTKEPVFIYFDGLPVPFFIESLTRRGTGRAIVRLMDIDSYNDAEELVGRKVWSETYSPAEGEEDLSMLVGWTVLSADGNRRYEITEFADIPGNPCIEVSTKNGAAMIPLHEDLIISFDPENREITMDIPEGLL